MRHYMRLKTRALAEGITVAELRAREGITALVDDIALTAERVHAGVEARRRRELWCWFGGTWWHERMEG